MLFNSYEFIFAFLPITVAGFWLLLRTAGQDGAIRWLLAASVAFYAYASLRSLAIIVPSILLDYAVARVLIRMDTSRQRARRILFVVGIFANVLFLGYFKYRNFFLGTANAVFAAHFELTRLILPLGISFLVFQKIAFLADVQSGELKTIRFLDFLLFTLFFPRTVAGPIVHYQEIVPQLRNSTTNSLATHLAVGLCLFSIGLFKKSVIADSLGQFVQPVFDPVPNTWTADLVPTVLTSWAALLAYTLQLYFDFSGYSDMALGAARMLGVRLPMNFNSPFKANNIVEFWGRWHITLTRFLTAYIYTPIVLKLTRVRMARGKSVLRGKRSDLSAIGALVGVPTLVTMTLSGLWHGAGWQFVVWGVLHGLYLSINQCWRLLRPRFWPDQAMYARLSRFPGRLLTFVSVVIALVFFRSTSIASAVPILEGLIGMNGVLPHKVQLLQRAGVGIPWDLLDGLLPVAAVCWIIGLLLVVMLLPNSLELLRRFQPALDFPHDESMAVERQAIPPVAPESCAVVTRSSSVTSRLVSTWAKFQRFWTDGVDLTPFTAAVVALLCVLGVMAMVRGGGFIYGQF